MQILKRLALVWIIWFAIHSIYIVIDGLSDNGSKADVAIVMGSKVNSDGTLSGRLKARVDKAHELLATGRVKSLVLSGGLGKTGYQEAEVMKTYLIAKGIADSLLIVDNMGSNTQATVENSIQPMRQNNWNSIIVISQYFHITRSKMLLRKEGFSQVQGVAPRYFEWRDLFSIFREFWAFYVGLL